MDKIPLLGTSRSRIVQELLGGPRTAVQLAASLRIQVSAARKHLDRLRSLGIVDERFERAGPGRPKKFYTLTEAGKELFPRHYDAVLNALVSEMTRDQGETRAQATLARVAHGFAAAAVPEPGANKAHLRRLTEGLGELGFEPTLTDRGGECTITSHNCPILKTAMLHRELVCGGLHAEIIRASTGSSQVRRGKWIVDGDAVCTHTFQGA